MMANIDCQLMSAQPPWRQISAHILTYVLRWVIWLRKTQPRCPTKQKEESELGSCPRVPLHPEWEDSVPGCHPLLPSLSPVAWSTLCNCGLEQVSLLPYTAWVTVVCHSTNNCFPAHPCLSVRSLQPMVASVRGDWCIELSLRERNIRLDF